MCRDVTKPKNLYTGMRLSLAQDQLSIEQLRNNLTAVLELRAVLNWYSSQFKNNHFTEMCCGTETGSYLRLIDFCITQLKAQGPSRTCNESKEDEEKKLAISLRYRKHLR